MLTLLSWHCPGTLQAALGPAGVVEGISAGKGYVDMSTVDEATSSEIAAAVTAKGGRFLEVRHTVEGALSCQPMWRTHNATFRINTRQPAASGLTLAQVGHGKAAECTEALPHWVPGFLQAACMTGHDHTCMKLCAGCVC